MSLAVFILPKGEFESELLSWKEKINQFYPNQPYTEHPPHLTLINLQVTNEERAVNAILALSGSVLGLELNINHTSVFWNDIATNGHTMYFGLRENKELFYLQKIIADTLSSFVRKTQAPKFLLKNKDYLNSFNKYGFPFVGDHWIPHFSVSSPHIDYSDPIIKEFLSSENIFSFSVNKVSLWHINGDEHINVASVELS